MVGTRSILRKERNRTNRTMTAAEPDEKEVVEESTVSTRRHRNRRNQFRRP